MGDNAIIFSYDTRVNALAFWGVIGLGILLFFVYILFRPPKKFNSEFRWFLLAEYIVALLLFIVVFRETPVFPDGFQNTFFANKRVLTGNVNAEWVVNVLMFIPIGWLLSSLIKRKRLVKALVIGMVFSLFIETLQFLLDKGVADIEDMACNTLGLLMGFFLWLLISAVNKRCMKSA